MVGRNFRSQKEKIENALSINTFKASEGWLQSFNRRHEIVRSFACSGFTINADNRGKTNTF